MKALNILSENIYFILAMVAVLASFFADGDTETQLTIIFIGCMILQKIHDGREINIYVAQKDQDTEETTN